MMRLYEIQQKSHERDFVVIYHKPRLVYHTTSVEAAKSIHRDGFRSGHDLQIAERRKAVYFSDRHVNPGLYARNEPGDAYAGQEAATLSVNIQGLKLLNLTYADPGYSPDDPERFVNHRRYHGMVVRGELDQIDHDVDGTISYLADGSIYEVALPVETANRLLTQTDLF